MSKLPISAKSLATGLSFLDSWIKTTGIFSDASRRCAIISNISIDNEGTRWVANTRGCESTRNDGLISKTFFLVTGTLTGFSDSLKIIIINLYIFVFIIFLDDSQRQYQ